MLQDVLATSGQSDVRETVINKIFMIQFFIDYLIDSFGGEGQNQEISIKIHFFKVT